MNNEIFSHSDIDVFNNFMMHCTWHIDSIKNSRKQYYSPYWYHHKQLFIPYRVGYRQFEGASPVNIVEEAMDLCLRTRHHDGFQREYALKTLFIKNYISMFPFTLPYIIRLAGEYVFEIYDCIYKNKDTIPKIFIHAFMEENREFVLVNMQRSISYWNDGYRDRIKDYREMPSYKFLSWILNV